MGGKFTIAGTVVGVFTIQTLESTILFLGVPVGAGARCSSPLVVIIVVLVQSPRRAPRGAERSSRSMRSSAQTRHADQDGGGVMTASLQTAHPPRRARRVAATAPS